MRWTREPRPETGDEKTETKFLWFPVTIDYETRWLEKATIVSVFHRRDGLYDRSGWTKIKFL